MPVPPHPGGEVDDLIAHLPVQLHPQLRGAVTGEVQTTHRRKE